MNHYRFYPTQEPERHKTRKVIVQVSVPAEFRCGKPTGRSWAVGTVLCKQHILWTIFFRVNMFALSSHLEVIELFRLYDTQPFAVHCRKQHFIIYHKLLRAAPDER